MAAVVVQEGGKCHTTSCLLQVIALLRSGEARYQATPNRPGAAENLSPVCQSRKICQTIKREMFRKKAIKRSHGNLISLLTHCF